MIRRIQFIIGIVCMLMLSTVMVQGQNVTPINFIGEHNGWTDSPTTFSAGHHRIIINATSDDTESNFKFRKGNTWTDNWGRGALIALKTKEFAYYNSGDNTKIAVTNGKYYSISLSDVTVSNYGVQMVQETSGDPVTIDAVTQSPLSANVVAGEDVTITITTSSNPSAEEIVYVRYTTNGFTNSNVVKATFVGTTGTAVIPNQGTKKVDYYVFSTTIDNISSDYDLATIKLNNNGGSNYTYTGNAWSTANDGDWSTAGTWTNNAVPSTTANLGNITISHNVTLDQNANISALTINSGKTFTASDATARTLTIANSASGSQATFTNNGTWANGTGGSTVVFTGAPSSGDIHHQISGTTAFQNVTINKTGGSSNVGADFQTGTSVTGTLRIGSGGYVATAPPSSFYGSSAILDFNQGASADYAVNIGDNSWSTTEVPNNITITTGTVTLNEERTLTGELLIQSGATLVTNGNFTLASGGVLTDNGTVTGNITFQRNLIDEVAGFRLLSSPVASTYSNLLNPIWTQGATGADYTGGNPNVFTWNKSSTDGANTNWVGVTDLSGNIAAGNGLLVYVYADDDYDGIGTATWPKTLSVTGTENAVDAAPILNTNANGWTLVGNPFATTIDFDGATVNDLTNVAYVWDVNDEGGNKNGESTSGSWKSWDRTGQTGDITGGLITSFQGFFVQNNGTAASPSIAFGAASKSTGGTFLGKANKTTFAKARLEVSGESVANSMWLQLSENGSATSEVMGDAVELQPLSNSFAELAAIKGGELFDIAHLPIGEKVNLPISFKTTETGVYTFTASNLELPSTMKLVFHDYETGEALEIIEDFSYEFEATGVKSKDMSPLKSLQNGPIHAKATGTNRFGITIEPGTPVSNEDELATVTEFDLEQNYPNPFNPTTTIKYSVGEAGPVSLTVYNVMGQKVAELLNTTKTAGTYQVNWNATGQASGIYYYRLQSPGQVITRQMTLIK